MTTAAKALIWSAVIALYALAAATGWLDEDVARTMFIVLPVLMWTSIRASRGCAPCGLFRRAGGE
ncbi:MAG: hypothetical protein JY451_05890 [Erythrobacter sp.]|nr:MAG: hypothetical protein JY451_05890 [Erythrobacter sp.]